MVYFAIVDIETTGGFSGNNRITEVAVLIHDGVEVVETYQTLLNPERSIPGFITGLTGIHQQMVANAPTFREIAQELFDLLNGKVFVAHNVNFDYSFIKEEFKNAGMDYQANRLCTVRLSRQVFPGLGSYSLGRLCDRLSIEISDRHRAFGDAEATAVLFGKLFAASPELILKTMKKNSGESFLPPHISKETYQKLPEKPGIYYFYDANGQVIYVGKANNIKSRFKGHFSGHSQGGAKLQLKTEIHDVTWELTGGEFLALLLEALEIKRLWPKYNRSQKNPNNSWGLYVYEDNQGFMRLQASKLVKHGQPVYTFQSHFEARSFLNEKCQYFQLCPRFCGLQKSNGACFDYQIGKCRGACKGEEDMETYNAKVKRMLSEIKQQKSKLLIRAAGRDLQEEAVLLFEEGILQGYGFVPLEEDLRRPEQALDFIRQVKPVSETFYILKSFISTLHPSRMQVLD
ncbi:exonuclease domain-containing protein [Pararhodonellum marinum]|uniref:exonuclease domain-containing protein n=1 Tax=Pararhodonellum marinum TaxID=2755358 RepID=UPI00188E5D5C|nr:exonuclease domain-containing protein [Pararhodonellum marinum]